MSVQLDPTRIVAVQDAHFIGKLITVGTAVLVGYDYLLTVQRESRLFWHRRINASATLFFANRYLALGYYVVLAYYRSLSFPHIEGCRTQYYIDSAIRHLQYIPWTAFSALRVYALSQRNWLLTGVTFFWSFLAFPLEYYGDFHLESFVDDPSQLLGCTPTEATPGSLETLGFIFVRGGQIIADAIVIGVTWKATHHARNGGNRYFLTTVMFRHSTLYFVIILSMNVLQILFTLIPNSIFHAPFTNTSYVVRFAEPVTTILISRFILDLHEADRGTVHHGDSSIIQTMGSDIGRLRFRSSRSLELTEWSVNSNPSRHTTPK